MKKKLFLLVSLSVNLIACTQNKKDMNKFLDDKILENVTINGYIFTEDGELPYQYPGYKIQLGNNIFEIDSSSYIDINNIKHILEKSDFKPLTYLVFREKIFNLYKIDTDTITYTYDLNPPIDNNHVTDAISKYGFMILYNGGWDSFVSIEELIMYNKMILNDDSLAFNWMKANYPEIIISQVRDMKVISNPKWLKYTFENTNFWKSEFTFHDFVFKGSREDQRYYLDKNMLDTMIAYGVDMSYLTNILATLEYAKQTNDHQYAGDLEDQIRFLYQKVSQVAQFGYIEGRLDNEPGYMQYLKDNNYWDDMEIKDFCEKLYKTPSERIKYGKTSNLEPEPTFVISDPDGFVNMRKEPNAKSEIIMTIPDDEFVSVNQTTDECQKLDWWKVQYEGKTGYVHKSRINVISKNDYLFK